MPKISELPDSGALAGAELVPITQSGQTVKTTVTAIGAKAIAADPTLAALSATAWADNAVPVGTGNDTIAQILLAANTFLARSSAGDAEAKSITDFALSILDDADASAVRSTLGAQAADATLTALAGANWAANSLPIGSGADTVSQVAFAANTFPARASTGNLVAKTITNFALSLLDDADATTALATLGVSVGTWTPTISNPTNITAITARAGRYIQVANHVLFAFRNEFTTSAGADTASNFDATLPVTPSNFVNTWDAIGTGVVTHTVYRPAVVIANSGAGTIRVAWQSANAAAMSSLVIGLYRVS